MRLWRRPFRKPASAELDRELEFHLDQLAREKMAEGLSPKEARRHAAVEFGGTENWKEEVRDVHRIPFADALWTHLRYAVRTLRGAPSFSLTVIATLTLGIGANTAVFSAIDAVLLRPLPYPEPDRLVVLHEERPKRQNASSFVAPVRLEDWNRLNSTFSAVSGYYTEDTSSTSSSAALDSNAGERVPVKIKRAFVAPRFLEVMGVQPILGHDFTSRDEHFSGYSAGNVLIGYRYWQEHFHADPNVIGKPLFPGKSSAIVIGVMPAGFTFPDNAEQWYTVPPDAPYATDRRNTWYTGLGRLRRGVSEAAGRANLNLVQSQLARQFPASDADLTVAVKALKESTVGGSRPSLWLLFGAVSILLLIACTNVSALVLARGMERAREFAVRFSLGASRGTILAQVLTETLLLAICGAVAGLALAAAASRLFGTLAHDIPRIGEAGLDWRLFVYTAACAIVVALLSGLFPALNASSAAPSGALSQGGRSQVGGRRPGQWVLVCVQVALAVCLLSGAGLMLRSFQALSEVSPGFDPRHVLAFRMTGSYGETADLPQMRQNVANTLEALRALPGVQSAALSLSVPGVPFHFPTELVSPDRATAPDLTMTSETRYVSDGYFETMRIPVLAGAGCGKRSDPPTAVVNRSFVSAYFNGVNPIGHHLSTGMDPFHRPPSTIVGVAGDAREEGMNHAPVPTVYWCGPVLDPARVYLLRATRDPEHLAGDVRKRLAAVEPGRAVYDLAPLTVQLSSAFGDLWLRTLLLSLFAATALTLACIGLYGTMSYFVTSRRREIGVRMALGARRGQVGRQFVLRGLGVTAAGVAAGLGLSIWAARFIAGMLYDTRTTDPAALSGGVATMLAVALLASAVPAIRAGRTDPMRILREE